MAQNVKDHSLLPLFEAFSLKCHQLQHAIRVGDERLVRMLDRELEPLIGAIIDHRAQCSHEVHQQLRFINSLIREDADDRSCVLRHSAMLAVLLERYFGSEGIAASCPTSHGMENRSGPGDDVFLNETVLNSLPDLVSVITVDYRYLFCNPAHARYFGRTPFDTIGRHVGDLFGQDWFQSTGKSHFDRCLGGETVEIPSWSNGTDGGGLECRLSPLAGSAGKTLGVIVMARPLRDGNTVLAA
ncbi:PAS domain-containing protein [Ciceribacter sp. L1K22]|uniref:PAS domain-containing protein n=1 Tax=Ciceribacter sp. L1K22 TaxID=2820275 RepID=UPI001ABDFF5E|nr:PAS domain-containing protein [Ciceribacter sp. L1K22]MBO3760527.1 PAS domain-containing protein [Ciceribacter sp. L1K22]